MGSRRRPPAAKLERIKLAVEAKAPLGQVLAAELEGQGTPELAAEVERLLPKQSVSLREVAAWATQRLLESLPIDGAEQTIAERGRLLNNLGLMLSAVGRREAALAAAEEAVAVYRGLAVARPDAFLPDLARSLGTYGTCLSAAGREREALAAYGDGIKALQPAFLSLPGAFMGLMGALVEHYARLAKELGEEPDEELAGQIAAFLQVVDEGRSSEPEQ